jgi:hypothetical protein
LRGGGLSGSVEFTDLRKLQVNFSKLIADDELEIFKKVVNSGIPESDLIVSGEDQAFEQPENNQYFMISTIGNFLNSQIPGKHAQCVNMQFEFLTAIHSGDRIDTQIECVQYEPEKHLATFRFNCFNQEKAQAITGQAAMLVSQ